MPRARVSPVVPVTAVCAVLVTAAALVTAWQFGGNAGSDEPGQQALPSTDPGEVCLHSACPVLATASAGDQPIELRATPAGDAGALVVGRGRTLQVKVTAVGARLTSTSLSCASAPEPGCLVSGDTQQGKVGEVFLAHQGVWERIDRQYLSSAGILGLRAVDGVLSVVAVQRDCGSSDSSDSESSSASATASDCDRVDARVFTADGLDLGCTPAYATKYELPRYPDVEPRRYQLRPCTDR